MALKVKRFLTSVNAANCYLCWCGATSQGAIVDPAEFTKEMRGAIDELGIELRAIYITHGHFDHNGAVDDVRKAAKATVFAAQSYPGGTAVSDGDVLQLGEVEFRVAATPGHTDDSICFITEGAAFVGDALFAAAVGGTADRAHFEQEVEGVREKILCLPADTVLYTGHGPATVVAIESCYNPFFF